MSRISSPPSSGGSSAAGPSSPRADSRGAAPHETAARSAAPHETAARSTVQTPSPTGLTSRAGAEASPANRQDQLRQRFSAVAGPRAALPAAQNSARASAAQPAMGSLAGAAPGDLAGPAGGPGMMGGRLPALGGAAQELAGPDGGHGMMDGHLGMIAEHDNTSESGYHAGASSGGGSSTGASSFLGGSFVHPDAPLHLNLPMGGGAGDTSSVAGRSSDFLIPTALQPADAPQPASPSASEAHSGPASPSTSMLAAGYEADEGGRGGGGR
jgi:hypothetical protein